MALFGVVFLGSTPIGGPLMGYVAEHTGTRAAMAIAGAVTLIAAIFALRKRLRSEAAGALKKAGTTLSTRRDGRRPTTQRKGGAPKHPSLPRLGPQKDEAFRRGS